MELDSIEAGVGRPNVLVVEDEDVMRRMYTRALGEADCWCAATGSGVEAIELLELQRFDLAVIDKNLPDVSGLEVARKARDSVPPVPVIIVTGYPTDASRHVAERLGVHSYMNKPFDLDEFRNGAREAIDSVVPPPVRSPDETPTVPPPPREYVSERVEAGASFLILEQDRELRSKLVEALSMDGHRVVAFQSRHQAEIQVRHVGYDVLVARPDALLETRHWAELARSGPPLGALAIVHKVGFDVRIEARMLGAQGVVGTSFSPERIAQEAREALARMRGDDEPVP